VLVVAFVRTPSNDLGVFRNSRHGGLAGVGLVVVQAPLPDVPGHIQNAERTGSVRVGADRLRVAQAGFETVYKR